MIACNPILKVIAVHLFICLFSDINECDDDTDDCEQICTNTEGSFYCSCMNGFILDDNGKNCTGECLCVFFQINIDNPLLHIYKCGYECFKAQL